MSLTKMDKKWIKDILVNAVQPLNNKIDNLEFQMNARFKKLESLPTIKKELKTK